MKDSEITVISVGPGAYDLITLRALKAIDEQEILIGAKDVVENFAKNHNNFIPERLISGTVDFINTTVYKKIGVLVSGDAGFFSLASTIADKFENVTVIPGVSSVNAGFASLKKQWGGFRFISVHGRDIFTDEITENTAILCDSENTPDRIIEKHPYIEDNFSITIIKDISMPSEKIYKKLKGAYDSTRLILVLETKK